MRCYVCDARASEPVAVVTHLDPESGVDRATPSGDLLVVRCARCGLLYLEARPTRAALGELRIPPPDLTGAFVTARVAAVTRALPAGAAVLHATDTAAIVHTPAVQASGEREYDLVIMAGALGRADHPVDQLADVRKLLRPGGGILVLTPNPAGPLFAIAKRRHWWGYDAPWSRTWFDESSLRRIAIAAGLTVRSMSTGPAPEGWLTSIRRAFVDWRPGDASLARVLDGPRGGPLERAAALLERRSVRAERGGWLCAELINRSSDE